MNSLKSQVLGAWALVVFEQQSPGGEIVYPLGLNAKGSIYYLPDGHVSVHIMDVSRSEDINEGLYHDKKLRYSDVGYLAYSGRFQVDEENHIMTHYVDISLYPEWIGGQQVRLIKLDGDRLQLSSNGSVGSQNIQFRLLWQRVANQ